MKLIIDGYNLIKKIAKSKHISVKIRDQYLKQLGDYAKNKSLQILIVFDGGDASFNYRERVYGIEVLYSGFLESADDVINRLIKQHNQQQELLIISSDNEIINCAASRSIDTLKSEDFYLLVQDSQQITNKQVCLQKNPLNKISAIINPDLDSLMELNSRQIKPKSEEAARLRVPDTQKLSKHEKQMLRKLKKL